METENTLPLLNPVEIRVLGALIEKSKTTPDYYPMTLNSLTAACNQKSSRNPVVDYDEETVVMALNSLKGRSLVAMAVGGTSRTNKYKHNFLTIYPMSSTRKPLPTSASPLTSTHVHLTGFTTKPPRSFSASCMTRGNSLRKPPASIMTRRPVASWLTGISPAPALTAAMRTPMATSARSAEHLSAPLTLLTRNSHRSTHE